MFLFLCPELPRAGEGGPAQRRQAAVVGADRGRLAREDFVEDLGVRFVFGDNSGRVFGVPATTAAAGAEGDAFAPRGAALLLRAIAFASSVA